MLPAGSKGGTEEGRLAGHMEYGMHAYAEAIIARWCAMKVTPPPPRARALPLFFLFGHRSPPVGPGGGGAGMGWVWPGGSNLVPGLLAAGFGGQ
jgi:hypothetical protein